MGLPTWQKYVYIPRFMATFLKDGRTKNKVGMSFFNVNQILKRHWIGNFYCKIVISNDKHPTFSHNLEFEYSFSNYLYTYYMYM